MSKMKRCPNDCGKMALRNLNKEVTFKSKKIHFEAEAYVCDSCGLETGTIEQTAQTQNAIADAYREKVGLLSGREIKQQRKRLRLSQQELADKAGVGIASVKRWENGIIQTKISDRALKAALRGYQIRNDYTGNCKSISIPRVKLVMKEFEKESKLKFLKKADKMLFDAKYVWYADMIAFNRLGRSITGATYATLPHGPQLNNYKELVDDIRDADENEADPLTAEEKQIITRIAVTFPKKSDVFNASHREIVWKEKEKGSIIPYSDAQRLTEITF